MKEAMLPEADSREFILKEDTNSKTTLVIDDNSISVIEILDFDNSKESNKNFSHKNIISSEIAQINYEKKEHTTKAKAKLSLILIGLFLMIAGIIPFIYEFIELGLVLIIFALVLIVAGCLYGLGGETIKQYSLDMYNSRKELLLSVKCLLEPQKVQDIINCIRKIQN